MAGEDAQGDRGVSGWTRVAQVGAGARACGPGRGSRRRCRLTECRTSTFIQQCVPCMPVCTRLPRPCRSSHHRCSLGYDLCVRTKIGNMYAKDNTWELLAGNVTAPGQGGGGGANTGAIAGTCLGYSGRTHVHGC